MLRISRRPISASNASTYYTEGIETYYTRDTGGIVGEWVGKGSAALGLSGEVAQEDFTAALKGLNPHTGQILIPEKNGKHVAGWDMCFSAPKSISIMLLAGCDGRLLQAHDHAVDVAFREVEQYALCHRDGSNGREYVLSQNVVAAKFRHYVARPSSSDTVDMHLHTHIPVLNMTVRPEDKEIRSLYPIEMYRMQGLGSAIYLSELSREVQKLGYQTETTTHYGAWEIRGFNREQIEAFSQRGQDIKKQMAQLGIQGSISSNAGNISRLSSRKPKADQDRWELEREWRERAASYGIPFTRILNEALRRGPSVQPADAQTVHAALEFSAKHGTEREAVLDVRKLIEVGLEHGMSKLTLSDVRAEIANQEKLGHLIKAGDDSPTHVHTAARWDRSWKPGGAFTTPEMLKLEQENIAMVHNGMGRATPIAEPAEVLGWAVQRELLPDQAGVAASTLASRDWVTAIEGWAGATKTTTVGAIKDFAEQQGHTVTGFGMTSRSVEELRGVGLNAQTVASLLVNPLPVPEGRQLWFVDESSLISTRSANELLTAARELGIERVVFVGDQRQHRAIEAGAPLRQFLRENMLVAELTQIRRQKDPELKRAVELAADGKPVEALDLLEAQQRVNEVEDTAVRYQRIVPRLPARSRSPPERLSRQSRERRAARTEPGNSQAVSRPRTRQQRCS
jgi:conjugative relaxase-like TrwC/TraI family protein